MALDGFLNVLKPPGMTSHDVVAWVRSRLGMKRIGHLGTLDPAAAGVLPLSLGRATRLFDHASGRDKAYRAEVVFGLQTDTLDAEGTIVASGDAAALTEARLRSLLPRFTGEIEQVPPVFSAVSVGGRRLHRSARAGVQIAAPPRRVTVTRMDLVDFTPGRRASALIDLVCTSGTYVRALADDLGKAAGCSAYLGFLVRTRTGRFTLAESATLEELSEAIAADRVDASVLPLDWPLCHLPQVALPDAEALAFLHGNAVQVAAEPAPRTRVYRQSGELIGLGEILPERALQPRLVLSSVDEPLEGPSP